MIDQVTFRHLARLLYDFQAVKPVLAPAPGRQPKQHGKTHLECFREWLALHSRAGLKGKTLFRFLFPELHARRRYDMKEQTLCVLLCEVYTLPDGTLDGWNETSLSIRAMAPGNLGKHLERQLLKRSCASTSDPKKSKTLKKVDALLDELASLSRYSVDELFQKKGKRQVLRILRELFANLEPFEAGCMVQIILRDLRPIMYPPPSAVTGPDLANYSANAYQKLEVGRALREWHWACPQLYHTFSDLDKVLDVAEHSALEDRTDEAELYLAAVCLPEIGTPVKIPKCVKPATGLAKATELLTGLVAAETKYDGERLQIHIWLNEEGEYKIKIFSKSLRDSTEDRSDLHPIILAALGLDFSRLAHLQPKLAERVPVSDGPGPSFMKLILEGEMVAWDEYKGQRADFYQIAGAKNGTFVPMSPSGTSYETGLTPSQPRPPAQPRMHRSIVWFDVLLIDDESLLQAPYNERRARLESLIVPIKAFSALADALTIDFSLPDGAYVLRRHFAELTGRYNEEGIILKPHTSMYNDTRELQRWIKLKKDYIPGVGDTLDFLIVGARPSAQRAMDLTLAPSTFTTFFVGLPLNNTEWGELGECADLPVTGRKKRYLVAFAFKYGFSRDQLAKLDSSFRDGKPEPLPFHPERNKMDLLHTLKTKAGGKLKVYSHENLDYEFALPEHLHSQDARPTYMARHILLAELLGAGSQKPLGCDWFELRWARLVKLKSPKDDVVANATNLRDMNFHGRAGELTHSSISFNLLSPDGTSQDDRVLKVHQQLERADKLTPAECLSPLNYQIGTGIESPEQAQLGVVLFSEERHPAEVQQLSSSQAEVFSPTGLTRKRPRSSSSSSSIRTPRCALGSPFQTDEGYETGPKLSPQDGSSPVFIVEPASPLKARSESLPTSSPSRRLKKPRLSSHADASFANSSFANSSFAPSSFVSSASAAPLDQDEGDTVLYCRYPPPPDSKKQSWCYKPHPKRGLRSCAGEVMTGAGWGRGPNKVEGTTFLPGRIFVHRSETKDHAHLRTTLDLFTSSDRSELVKIVLYDKTDGVYSEVEELDVEDFLQMHVE